MVRVRVLMHPLVKSSTDNSFTLELAAALEVRGVEVNEFSWLTAFISRYDVLHVHWPETLVRGATPFRSIVKSALFVLLIAWCRIRGRRLVATVHNLQPHEKVPPAAWQLIQFWYKHADAKAYFTRYAAAEGIFGGGQYVPHPAYELPSVMPASQVRGRVVSFGYVRRYKNLEASISVIGSSDRFHLVVAGKAVPLTYGNEIRARARSHSNIEVRLGSMEFESLVSLVQTSEYVLLPYPRLYSSGAAMLAMSVGRPVILLDSQSGREMQEEFGANWVGLLPRVWDINDFHNAVATLEAVPRKEYPELARRQVAVSAQLYEALYRGKEVNGNYGDVDL